MDRLLGGLRVGSAKPRGEGAGGNAFEDVGFVGHDLFLSFGRGDPAITNIAKAVGGCQVFATKSCTYLTRGSGADSMAGRRRRH